MAQPESPPIGEFLTELHRRLDLLGPEGVRDAVEAHARSLRPSERQALLDVFASGRAGDVVDGLLVDVDRLVGRIEVLDAPPWWPSRWGGHAEESPYPVETGTIEDLLIAAGERFLTGDVDTAAVAFGRLLTAAAAGIDDDDRQVDFHIDHELAREARDRLVWCLARGGGVTSDDRATRIIDAIDSTDLLVAIPDLETILHAHPDLGPIDDAVLRALAARLTTRVADGRDWSVRSWLGLTLQITEHLDGLGAVLALARSDTQSLRLDIYRWLSDRYVDLGEVAGAADVALEGLDRCTDSWDLARLADVAVGLLEDLDRVEDAVAAAERAWRAHPTKARLETVLDTTGVEPAQVVARLPIGGLHDPFLTAALAILGGDLDGDAVGGSKGSAGADGWATAQLVAAARCRAGASEPPLHLIEAVIRGACRAAGRHSEATGLIRNRGSVAARKERVALDRRLLDAVAEVPLDLAHLDAARRTVDAVTDQILTAKQRPHYATAAELVVLLGHALESAAVHRRSRP